MIARAGGSSNDIVICTGGQSAVITVTNSAYGDTGVCPAGGTITDTGGHVTAAPAFADGEFHQQPGSATIDAGSALVFAPHDFDLQARPFGSAPDIGADEHAAGSASATGFTEHVTGASSGVPTLHGALNPGGGPVAYRFAQDTDADLSDARHTPERGADGLVTIAATEQVPGLLANTTYYYRLEVTKNATTTAGATRSFTMPPFAPTATTGDSEALNATSAKLNATVTPNGASTQVSFQHGISQDYDSQTLDKDAGSGSTPQAVSATIRNLTPGQTLHYRVRAVNAKGTTFGADRSLVLPAATAASTSTPAPTAAAVDTRPPLVVAALAARLDRRKRAVLRLTADDDSPPVRVTIELSSGSRVIGRETLTAPAGRAATVRITLSSRSRRHLRRRGRLRVRARIVATDARRNAKQLTARRTLRR